jgi:hypothetical protein
VENPRYLPEGEAGGFDVFVGIVAAWVGRLFEGFDILRAQDAYPTVAVLTHPLSLGCMQNFED